MHSCDGDIDIYENGEVDTWDELGLDEFIGSLSHVKLGLGVGGGGKDGYDGSSSNESDPNESNPNPTANPDPTTTAATTN